MSTIKAVLEEELGRLKRLQIRCEKVITSLPAGSISIKKRNGNEYAYRAYRDSGTVKTDYIGPADSDKVAKLKDQVLKRKKLESLLKATLQQAGEIERSLRGKKI